MKKLISVSVILLMSAPAYANLSWSTSTAWNTDAITSALTSVRAGDATSRNFNARWGAMTNKTVNGAYMGGLYAASIDGNVTPVAAVNAGYDFMQELIAAQNRINTAPAVSASEPVAENVEQKSESDSESESSEQNETDDLAQDVVSGPVDVAIINSTMREFLDNRCHSDVRVVNSPDMRAYDSVINCKRITDNANDFRCDYSRKYILGGVAMNCTVNGFDVSVQSDGKLKATTAVLQWLADADTKSNDKQESKQSEPDKTDTDTAATESDIDVSIADAEFAVANVCRGNCDRVMMSYNIRGMEKYKISKNKAVCKKRGGKNQFECNCVATYSAQKRDDLTCSSGFAGTVRTDGSKYYTDGRMFDTQITDYDVGEIGNVRPMEPLTLGYELIPRKELTKKEQRQAAREAKKELREIEKSDKKDAETKPSYVSPLSDGTDGDLKPDNSIPDEFLNAYTYTPTKKEQRQATKVVKKGIKENKKSSNVAPAAPLPPRASVPEPDYLEMDLYTTTIDVIK